MERPGCDQEVRVTDMVSENFRLRSFYTEIRRLCVQKGWRHMGGEDVLTSGDGPGDGPWFAAYIALLHSEVSEALEAYRDKIWSDSKRVVGPACDECKAMGHESCGHHLKPVGVGPELADVFIRLIDMADIWGINLDAEVRRVLDYGWTREFQHGGKTL
jgi:hypothetical protein